MHFYQFGEWEFYDLQADPDELTNLYNYPAQASRVEQLKAKLSELREFYEDESVFLQCLDSGSRTYLLAKCPTPYNLRESSQLSTKARLVCLKW